MTQNPSAEMLRELLVGRHIVSVDIDNRDGDMANTGKVLLDDGTMLEVRGNEGCGGCYNGWFSITTLNRVENVITNVETNYADDDDEMVFQVFVFAQDERLLLLQADGYDNGWYGTGYWLTVIAP